MKAKLNEDQQELINKAIEQGFLTNDDFSTVYSSPITIKQNIRRFILLGLLKKTDDKNKFDFIQNE